MSTFRVTVTTSCAVTHYYALASTAGAAGEHAVAAQGGEPCGVAVRPL